MLNSALFSYITFSTLTKWCLLFTSVSYKFYHPGVYTGKRKTAKDVCVCVVKSTVLHYKDV